MFVAPSAPISVPLPETGIKTQPIFSLKLPKLAQEGGQDTEQTAKNKWKDRKMQRSIPWRSRQSCPMLRLTSVLIVAGCVDGMTMRPRARVGLIWDIDGTLCDSFELGHAHAVS